MSDEAVAAVAAVDAARAVDPVDAVPSSRRTEFLAFAELFALSGIAIAQPLLDLLSKNTGIFVAHRSTGIQVVALVVLVLVAVPLALWLVEYVLGSIWPRTRRVVHACFAGVLVVALALEIVKKQTHLGTGAIVGLAVACGVIGAALVFRVAVVRQFLHILAIAPVVFAVLFLVSSSATDVVFSTKTASATGAGVKTPHRVVMIMLDEFPEMSILDGKGHVDGQIFPNLARFADDSTWYRNESTVAPYTDFAVPAILSGQYPKDPAALPVLADYPNNLFTLLRKSYALNVHESVTRLCPTDVCKGGGTGGGFGGLVSQSAQLWKEYVSPTREKFSFADDVGVSIALQTMNGFVRSLKPSRDPRLDFVHIVYPHNPWHYLPSLQDTRDKRLPGAETLAWGNQELADAGRQRHLLQAQAADVLVGRVIDKLKAIGAYDDSMVVITADHGVAFTAGEPMRSISEKNYPQIMWPPLFIKYPNETAAKVDDRPAESVDIVPTIADVIGMKIPYAVDGRSLRGAPRAEGARPFYSWKISGGFGLAGGLTAPPGEHLEFDGGKGFREVLQSRAAPPGADPALRVYQSGKFGALVGRPLGALVHDEPNQQSVGIGKLGTFANVDPTAHDVPWAYQQGGVHDANGKMSLAVGISGRIVAVSEAAPTATGATDSFFTFMVPPQLVHAGRNDVTVYLIRGTPSRPSLDPLPLEP